MMLAASSPQNDGIHDPSVDRANARPARMAAVRMVRGSRRRRSAGRGGETTGVRTALEHGLHALPPVEPDEGIGRSPPPLEADAHGKTPEIPGFTESTRSLRFGFTRPSAQRELEQDGLELVDGPVEIGRVDDDRRGQTDGRTVRVLREQAALHEQLADVAPGAERGVDVDSRPESCAADGDDAAPEQTLETGVEAHPEQAGAFLRFAGGEHPDHRAADGRGQRVAAEGRAVLARSEDAEDVRVADDRRDGDDAAAERLAEQVEVGHDPDEVAGEGRAGAAEARLDLVGDEQHVALGADRPDRRKVVGRRHEDAGLALDGFDQHGHGVVVDRVGERRGVAVGHGAEARRERAEIVAGVRVVGEAHDGGGAAVEVAGGDDDVGASVRHALHAVPPGACDLDARLDGLGAGVHRKHHVLAGERGERLDEGAELVVVEGAAREREAVELRAGRIQQLRIRVAEVHRGVRREAVEVAPAVEVGHPRALTGCDHDRQRMVVVRGVRLLARDRLGLVRGRRGRLDVLVLLGLVRSHGRDSSPLDGTVRARSTPQLQGAALDAAAAEQELGEVDADRVVAVSAKLPVEVGGTRRDHDVVAVRERVETQHRRVVFGDDDRVRVAIIQGLHTRFVERTRQVGDVLLAGSSVEHRDRGVQVVEARVHEVEGDDLAVGRCDRAPRGWLCRCGTRCRRGSCRRRAGSRLRLR